MTFWREELAARGLGDVVEALTISHGDWPLVREHPPPTDERQDAPSAVVNCPSCRRDVTPKDGPLGAQCARCGSFLPRAKRPAARRSTSPPEPSRAEVVAEVAEELLVEFGERVRTVGECARLRSAATAAVARAAAQDVERVERRERARFWREHPAMAGLVA